MEKTPGIRYKHVVFNATWAASKSFSEFFEHEKHHGFSREEMKPIHDACKAEIRKNKKSSEPEADQPAEK